MKLQTNRRYWFERVGNHTAHTAQGLEYLFEYNGNDWVSWGRDDDGKLTALYNSAQSTLLNPKFWKFIKEEGDMSFDKVKDEALEIKTNAVIINGADAASFSDNAIIKMMQAEEAKVNTLTEQLKTGKYLEAKTTKMRENIAALAAILDSRV